MSDSPPTREAHVEQHGQRGDRRDHHYGDALMVELPAGSGQQVTLDAAADELCRRLARIFLGDEATGGRRPVFGDESLFQDDPHWRDHVLFYEYFHGDTGAGVGASHQTGWTALAAKLMQDTAGSHTRNE